jgi:hypothetical protein
LLSEPVWELPEVFIREKALHTFISVLSLTVLPQAGPALAAQTGVNLDGNVSNVLASTPVFAGSYSATPNQARVGQAITLNATITDKSGSLSNGNVTLEVHDSSNQKIFQKYFLNQSFASGEQKSYSAVWTPTLAGTYTYQVGVMDSTWSTDYLWATPSTISISTASTGDTRQRDSYGWVSCSSSFVPLSDAQAAALVVPTAENRPGNTAANQYRPSNTELSTFLNNEKDWNRELPVQDNPYFKYVTGGFSGTTDEIIQWGAAKWGIPADWLRAEYVLESYWNMSALGDLTSVANPLLYPAQSRATGNQVYQSLGITQLKWNHPDQNNTGIGTEPLRWKSTAFNVDYPAARVRFYFDNPQGLRSAWGDGTYSPCNNWLSLAGWYESYPWNNSGQQSYVQSVQTILANRTWAQPGF